MSGDFDYDADDKKLYEAQAELTRAFHERASSQRINMDRLTAQEKPFVPAVIQDKQSSAWSQVAQRHNGGSGGAGSSSAGGVASGSVPPEPQLNEPGDDDISEDAQVDTFEEAVTVETVETVEAESESEQLDESEDVDSDSDETSEEESSHDESDDEQEHQPLELRNLDGDELQVTIDGDVKFVFEGDESRAKRIPTILVDAIREELVRLGAPDLAAKTTQNKTLSVSSLLTALVMSALDITVPGIDENTRRAAEVLRTGQGRIVAVETKVSQLLANQERTDKELRLLRQRSVEMDKLLHEMELMLTWLMTDKVETHLNNTATAKTIELAPKTVIDVRARLRDQAKSVRDDERLRQGRGQIVE